MKQNMMTYTPLSREKMRLLLGGFRAYSDCSMTCKNGKTIKIEGCDGACGCSEVNQGCACYHNGSTQCSQLCED